MPPLRKKTKSAVTVKEKRCSKCGKTKPAVEFGTARSAADGLQAYCYPCAREYRRGQAARNKAKHDAGETKPRPTPRAEAPWQKPAEAIKQLTQHEHGRREDQILVSLAGLPRMPRTTELTREVQDRICLALECGNTMRAACNAAGVNSRTFEGWLALGQQRNAPAKMVALVDAVEGAEAWGEMLLVGTVREDATLNSTSAKWLLERRYSKGKEAWIRPERIEHVGADGEALVEASAVRAQILEKLTKLDIVKKEKDERARRRAADGEAVQ